MKESSADVLTPCEITKLYSGNGKTIERVTITHIESGDSHEIEIDEMIVSHGQKNDFTSFKDWGLDMHAWTISVSPKLETNLPGIFGAGECAKYDSKLNLIAGAFTDAALALNSANRYMDPEAPRMAKFSTSNEKFKERNKSLGISDE